jgi:hypothetical protein
MKIKEKIYAFIKLQKTLEELPKASYKVSFEYPEQKFPPKKKNLCMM